MPPDILAHPRLTGDARIVASYLWAVAHWQAGAMLRTTYGAIAEALATAERSVRDHVARLAAEGYLAIVSARRGRPEHGGGVEMVVHGPAALAQRLREHRPADTAQTRLPLAAADDRVADCRDVAREVSDMLSARRPHTCHQHFVALGAMLACGVPIHVVRRDGGRHGPVALTREDVLSAARAAASRGEPGQQWYYLLRDRLSAAAGVDVRMPSPAAIRAAAESIGWGWRRTWAESPRDLMAAWRAAREAGDERDYSAWCAARDEGHT